MKKLLIAMAMMSAMAMAQTSAGSTDQSTNSSSTPAASSTQSSTSTDSSAQTPDTSTTKSRRHHKDQASADAKPESDKSSADAKEKTVTGCLHKDGDNMWLETGMKKMGMGGKYHVMSSQDLSAHDGHKVKVTGKVSKGPMPGDDKKQVKHLEATNVAMVSDKCSWTNDGGKKDDKATTTKK